VSNAVNVLRSGDLELDLVRRRVARLGKAIDLRPKEFLLLEYLVRNANRPVTRTMILEHVWNSSFEGLTNVVDVYISALRSKVDRDFPQKLIQTNRGIGYTFTGASGPPPAPNGHST
jgi:DNA-binding response OmpR family regulator